MKQLIVFNHIPKTAGSSFREEVIQANLSSDQMYRYQQLLPFIKEANTNDNLLYIEGHMPYGLHVFINKEVKYITFLRDPLERALSFYSFIKDSNVQNYKHPLRDYADSVTIKQFYENRNMANWQTRYLAGFISDRLYSKVSTSSLETIMLERAKENLKKKYLSFGILEKYEESVSRLMEKLSFELRVRVPHRMKTKKRIKSTELDDETLLSLKNTHNLDIELYNFALDLFERQK